MDRLEINDEETPIENHPGFLGYFWDHELAIVDAKLQALKDFPWQQYSDCLQTTSDRTLNLNLSTGPLVIKLTCDTSFAEILGQLPSIQMTVDVPPNQGPSGGVENVFFVADNSDFESAVNDIMFLLDAMGCDYATIT